MTIEEVADRVPGSAGAYAAELLPHLPQHVREMPIGDILAANA
jgi:hypothetical protein